MCIGLVYAFFFFKRAHLFFWASAILLRPAADIFFRFFFGTAVVRVLATPRLASRVRALLRVAISASIVTRIWLKLMLDSITGELP